MGEINAEQKFACPACGAEAVWNPAQQTLVCPYCGAVSPMAASGEPAGDPREHDLVAALQRIPDDRRGWERDRVSVQCQSCKAISLFSPEKVAQRCEFCGSASVVPYQATRAPIVPETLLPMRVAESAVREQIRQWYGSHWFAPGNLKRRALTDTLHGLYIPYWTFDAGVHADWTADAGHYYYETESYRDSHGRTATRRVRKVRWVPAAGSLEHFFDDLLVPGTRGVDHGLLAKVEPFPTGELVPYDRAYVSGWVVEQYQIDLVAAASNALDRMQKETEALCARDIPADTHRNLQVDARFHDQTFKHVLVPIWLLAYTFGRQTFQVVVNGYSGKIAGRYPLSWIKITLLILAIALVVLVVAALMNEHG